MSVLGRCRMMLLMVCLLFAFFVSAADTKGSSKKEKRVATKIKTWHLADDYSVADTLQADTSYINLPMRELPRTYSIANSYNGNFVSPIESKIYFDRKPKLNFLFAQSYIPYLITSRDVQFYNTTTPYSRVEYKRGFTTYREEHDIDFFFTGNIGRRLNLGVGLNYLTGVGHYESQAGKRFNGQIFGSYNGNHYSIQAGVVFNTLTNQENGGLDTLAELGGALSSYDLPYRMSGQSALKHISGFFNHYYSLTVERERRVPLPEPRGGWIGDEPRDTVIIDYIPVTTFKHTFECGQTAKQYLEKSVPTSFFENTYFSTGSTRDTASVINLRNTLSVTFEEEFNKWLRFGATVFATNEFERYAYTVGDTASMFTLGYPSNVSSNAHAQLFLPTDTVKAHHWTNNTWIGASLYKNNGKYIHYGFSGEVCLAGYKIGEFAVRGHLDGDFRVGRDTMYIKASAYVKNQQPDWFMSHYRSNHYIWENDFQKIYRFYVGGEISYPTKYVKPSARVRFENITRHIYFDSHGLPRQHDANIQVLAVDAKVDIRTKRFGMENTVVYQLSSSNLMPLPTLALYHNVYYHDCWFKALMVQMGVDMNYNTAYYAPLLNPATGQFMVQNWQKVGNYPVLNVYANFYVKLLRLKFFAQFTHFNYYFMKNKTYYSMPNYPLNPPVFRAGLAWHFYN